MRFGLIAAAAVFVMAGTSAEAATVITQSFNSTFSRNGSRGPIQIGNLNLVNQIITSAVISFGAGQNIQQNIFSTSPATFTYSGNSGFFIQGQDLVVPSSVSVAFSGVNSCSIGSCSASNSFGGDYVIPQENLAAFAGSGYLQIAALSNISGFVFSNSGVLLQDRQTSAYASGTITYLIANVAPVPEAATWAMMILGVAAIGAVARRRRVVTQVSFA